MDSDGAVSEGMLRDRLAVYRTVLANERTLLSYARTAMAIGAVGFTLLEFTERPQWQGLGAACFPVAVVLMGLGLWRYAVVRRLVTSTGLR